MHSGGDINSGLCKLEFCPGRSQLGMGWSHLAIYILPELLKFACNPLHFLWKSFVKPSKQGTNTNI